MREIRRKIVSISLFFAEVGLFSSLASCKQKTDNKDSADQDSDSAKTFYAKFIKIWTVSVVDKTNGDSVNLDEICAFPLIA